MFVKNTFCIYFIRIKKYFTINTYKYFFKILYKKCKIRKKGKKLFAFCCFLTYLDVIQDMRNFLNIEL